MTDHAHNREHDDHVRDDHTYDYRADDDRAGNGHARNGHATAAPAELTELLDQVVPPGGSFGHRQHVNLAFLAVRAYGTSAAVTKIASWLRHITAYERVPQKYNATMTRAWTEIVGQHVQADAADVDFAEFASRYPALLDKRLLSRHYSSALLASAAARRRWVEPDLLPFPWSKPSDGPPISPVR